VREAFLEDLGQRPFGKLCRLAYRAIQVLGQFKGNRLGWHTHSPHAHGCCLFCFYYTMRVNGEELQTSIPLPQSVQRPVCCLHDAADQSIMAWCRATADRLSFRSAMHQPGETSAS